MQEKQKKRVVAKSLIKSSSHKNTAIKENFKTVSKAKLHYK